jgi:hypothetical protein
VATSSDTPGTTTSFHIESDCCTEDLGRSFLAGICFFEPKTGPIVHVFVLNLRCRRKEPCISCSCKGRGPGLASLDSSLMGETQYTHEAYKSCA